MAAPKISAARLREHLERLGTIGRDPAGGVTRPPFSAAHAEAVRITAAMMREAGLDVGVDEFGILLGRRAGVEGGALLAGSHLDTVPQGGIFDGALGVIAAIECAQALQEAGRRLRHPLVVVAFADEEGYGFGVGTLSSRALVGEVPRDRFAGLRDAAGRSLAQHLAAREHGLPVARIPSAVTAYLELHPEQGPVLEHAGRSVAAVESITGILRTTVTFEGEARHAGTTPMDARADALAGAAELVIAVRDLAQAADGRAVGTVGHLRVAPGAANVIPGRAELSVELRSPDEARLEQLRAAVDARVHAIAGRGALRGSVGPWDRSPAVAMDAAMRDRILVAMARAGHPPVTLPSWAGHDAGVMARYVPSGMIFVTSTAGISHSPREHTPWEAAAAGARVLLDTWLLLDESPVPAARLPLAYAD